MVFAKWKQKLIHDDRILIWRNLQLVDLSFFIYIKASYFLFILASVS